MRSLNPEDMARDMPRLVKQWAQSVHKAMSGNIDMGVPTGKDSNGVYNTFSKGNQDGVLVRVGAASSSEPYKWVTVGTGVVINHGLVDVQGNPRQPIGFKLVDKDGAVDVYRTVAPDTTQITVATTDITINVTLYIF